MVKPNISGDLDGSGIAVIGMAGRFPGARNVEEFWKNLRDGVESISFFTPEEMAAAGMNDAAFSQPSFVPAGGVLDDAEMFDAAFFGYSPREAEIIDPQHRLFLECAWEALENAGYDPDRYEGAVGVFAGSALSSYMLNLGLTTGIIEVIGVAPILIANETDYLTTRVSYKLNLRGPSVNLQTACSTSLVAVHVACQSILNGECHLALAGGVTIITPQKVGYWYQEGGILSPDGHCRAFDAQARGTVGGNGLGIVVLKRFADALMDRDTIYAVIRGSAINNDGAGKLGFTAPSVDGQEAVIAEAQAIAGVEAGTITYVEAHGTATQLGDPVEMQALAQAFRAQTGRKQFCALGSVKTNVGHLDAAAGVTGLIKTVLALKHKEIPPSLHFEKPNLNFDLADSPFYINTILRPWESADSPRRAGVSSFGIGGTNAHIIVEEAPEPDPEQPSRHAQLLTLSARTPAALEAATDKLLRHLRARPGLSLANVSFTLHLGRREFAHRRALACADAQDAMRAVTASSGSSASAPMRKRPPAWWTPRYTPPAAPSRPSSKASGSITASARRASIGS